ncbi:MAG: efflux RND transporter periplasmic adaptor subunit [Acidobacteriaceae bacterium]|nr:efflux RND transporter periplasmic adaptor subunit [Acidobacteriaceae bacterium]
MKEQKRSRTRWIVAACVLAAVLVFVWFGLRPTRVQVIHPKLVSLTETIASSARVGGVQESAVGAQFTGTVQQLFVRIGDRVKTGQVIAVLRNEVTQQQKAQAETAVATARARLAQVSKPPLPSELNEAEHAVSESRAQVSQINAQMQLAAKDYERAQQMYSHGLIARAEFERLESNQQSLQSQLRSAKAATRVREARQETLQKGPLPEDVMVARAQLSEAEQALQVAGQQSKEARVLAPFDGVVTALNAEQGQMVGANGVVNLVSNALEIRVDLDESNLADLELGQTAILSAAAFGGKTFQGKLTDLGAAVNEARGIVTVKITPENPPDWLRPGQTVNVNLVTNEAIDRLLVPSTAIVRQGGRTLVMVVNDKHVAEKMVATRPATDKGIPIASGLSESYDVIVNPSGLRAGQEVRVRR